MIALGRMKGLRKIVPEGDRGRTLAVPLKSFEQRELEPNNTIREGMDEEENPTCSPLFPDQCVLVPSACPTLPRGVKVSRE